eukprot:SAG11_NODE_4001_length_2113_cov_1.577954_3_plen_63_part_01
MFDPLIKIHSLLLERIAQHALPPEPEPRVEGGSGSRDSQESRSSVAARMIVTEALQLGYAELV